MPIEIVAKITDWLPTDAEKWAAFLETETGKRLLPYLAENAPLLLAKGETNEILIRMGEVRGMQTLLRAMIEAAHPSAPSAPSPASEYPPLTDDSKWDDGQKLTFENSSPEQPSKE